MDYILIALSLFVIFGLIIFIHEIKNAKEVDKKEPFLNDDYDPGKDPTLKKD